MKLSDKYINDDCMNHLVNFKDNHFDLAICDPPYNNNDAIGIVNSKKHKAKRKDYHLFKNVAPNQEYFKQIDRVCKRWIIWGGNYFGLKGGVIAWNKFGSAFGEGEVAICNTHNSVIFFEYRWNGMLQEDMKNKEQKIHPTQKPIQLYKLLLKNYTKQGDLILDTHVGSASSLIAFIQEGFDFIGFEIDKDYYKDSYKRVVEVTSQSNLMDYCK